MTAQNREQCRQMPFCRTYHSSIGTLFVLKTLAKTKIPLPSSCLKRVKTRQGILKQRLNALYRFLFLESVKANSTDKMQYALFFKTLAKWLLPVQTSLDQCGQILRHLAHFFYFKERLLILIRAGEHFRESQCSSPL